MNRLDIPKPSAWPKTLFGYSHTEWLLAYERFGPYPEHARLEVDGIFAHAALAVTEGAPFIYDPTMLLPLARAHQPIARVMLEWLQPELAELAEPAPVARPRDFPGTEEAWVGTRAALRDAAARHSAMVIELRQLVERPSE